MFQFLGFSCIFIMGYVSISAADKILSKNAEEHLKSVLASKKHQVEDFVNNRIIALESFADMPITFNSIDILKDKRKEQWPWGL